MKQKYAIEIDTEKRELILKEYAELDKEMLSLLCQQSYDLSAVESAAGLGRTELIKLIRTQNLYPPSVYMDRLADEIMAMVGAENETTASEVFFDDLELLTQEREALEAEMAESDDDDLEDLLDDDDDDEGLDDEFGDDDIDISSGSSLKIADDDSLDIDDDA